MPTTNLQYIYLHTLQYILLAFKNKSWSFCFNNRKWVLCLRAFSITKLQTFSGLFCLVGNRNEAGNYDCQLSGDYSSQQQISQYRRWQRVYSYRNVQLCVAGLKIGFCATFCIFQVNVSDLRGNPSHWQQKITAVVFFLSLNEAFLEWIYNAWYNAWEYQDHYLHICQFLFRLCAVKLTETYSTTCVWAEQGWKYFQHNAAQIKLLTGSKTKLFDS